MTKIKTGILVILVILLGWSVLGFITGLGQTLQERDINGEDGCRYKSVASITNLGYIVSCELFRARFDLPKRK